MSGATPIADMITEMLKNCIPLDMIIVAVRSVERAVSTRHPVDETAEKRRAWDREYRRLKRERPPDPPDIHPIPPDVDNNALSFLEEDKRYSELVSKKNKQEKKERSARGKKLPPDWIPKKLHYEAGEKLGMNRAAVDARADAMRTWCDANSNRAITTKSNWDAAFMGTWLKETRNGHGTGNTRTTGHDAILAVQTRKAIELDRKDPMAGPADAAGFAFGDGIDRPGPGGNRGAAEPDQPDHQRHEPDDQRIREGEIIPPDKDAAGISGRRQFV